jgi:Holliday junction resolvasome RuvABC DNA-binding subunit
MGKKSRLKKIRKESHSSKTQKIQCDSTQFVEQLEQLGYRLKQIQRFLNYLSKTLNQKYKV